MTVIISRLVLVALVALPAGACISGRDEDSSYTLYRTSVVNDSMRIHVATFDAAGGELYNRENCEVASSLFQAQEGVKTRFFCEKGFFRK